ncbi:hypothetical protein [Streptomyces sp. NBC_01314]|uniref:hypothetical protein n=1 Tax=Streptomyces sp. NBC_01314 TaxID=2903821 RepID=UPI003089166E|nr:hypothetical protein OG622_43725 [Streptomyces sp. NBC_01314]
MQLAIVVIHTSRWLRASLRAPSFAPAPLDLAADAGVDIDALPLEPGASSDGTDPGD